MIDFKKIKDEIEKEEVFKKEQERLHDIHKNIDKDKVIVEKSSLLKYFINIGIRLIKVLAGISLIIFSSIGIISLTYPKIRVELLSVLMETLNELRLFFNL